MGFQLVSGVFREVLRRFSGFKEAADHFRGVQAKSTGVSGGVLRCLKAFREISGGISRLGNHVFREFSRKKYAGGSWGFLNDFKVFQVEFDEVYLSLREFSNAFQGI